MFKRPVVASFLLSVALIGSPVDARTQDLLLAPVPASGVFIPPFFEGYYKNPDGSATYSFGFLNRNRADTLEIPIGPDNYVEPAEFNGRQPTSFPPGRHTGVFGVTVPPGYEGEVVWHLRTNGRETRVPGRATAGGYQLSYNPMALGSLLPEVRFERGGPSGLGPHGIVGPPVKARVGQPVELSIWAVDPSVRERPAKVVLTWYKHQGPGRVAFADVAKNPDAEGRATVSATFDAPGAYVVRVRADNFEAADSDAADQCCWTNGFVTVTVD